MRYQKINSNEDSNYEEEQMYSSILEQSELYYEKLNLIKNNLNRRLLQLTIKTLENSFFWKFRSYKSKINKINETYQILEKIISYEEIE